MIEFAPASEAQVPELAALATAALPEAWSERSFRSELRQRVARVWAARENGRLLGFAALRRVADELQLLSLAVDDAARRRGVATRLLEVALGAEPGVRAVHLEVRESNHAAQRLYAGLGFEATGRRPRHYGDEAAVLMTRAA